MTMTSAITKRSPQIVMAVLVIIVLTLAFPLRSPAQELARRLILKDGSYQSITKYEVKGDRVRYYSAEREEWEELPSSLVDWPATEKFEKDRASAPAIPEAALIDKETDAEREAEEAHLPEVAPGLHLPELSGLFLLDNFKGQPQLDELQQAEGDIDRKAKTNILRGAVGSGKATVELDGEHATIFSHVAVPSIYIRADDEDSSQPPPGETASAKPSQPSLDAPRAEAQKPEKAQQPEQSVVPFDRFRIVQLKIKNGKRIVGDIKRSTTGKVSQDQNSLKTTIDLVASGWFKLTPTEDLAPGEYAVVEMKGAAGMNLYIWPFAVNPTAQANANPWTPDAKEKKAEPAKSN
ncbi:MAG: hypothetical protein WAL56_00315 [Candidatus Sulfotelmatobacter sp.]